MLPMLRFCQREKFHFEIEWREPPAQNPKPSAAWYVAHWEAKQEIEARERGRKRYEEEEKLKDWVQQNPKYRLVRRDGHLYTELRPTEEAPKQEVAVQPQAPKPAPTDSAAQVRTEITGMIRKNLPGLSKAYNEALQKEAEKQAAKKPPQKETLTGETETKATTSRS